MSTIYDATIEAQALANAGVCVIVKHYKSQATAARYAAKAGLAVVQREDGLGYFGVRPVQADDVAPVLPREHQFGAGLGDYVAVTDGQALDAHDGYLSAYRAMTGTAPGAGLRAVVAELDLWADEAAAVLGEDVEPEPTTDVETLSAPDPLPATPVGDLRVGDTVRRAAQNYAGAEIGAVVAVHVPGDHEPRAVVRFSDGDWSGTNGAWTRQPSRDVERERAEPWPDAEILTADARLMTSVQVQGVAPMAERIRRAADVHVSIEDTGGHTMVGTVARDDGAVVTFTAEGAALYASRDVWDRGGDPCRVQDGSPWDVVTCASAWSREPREMMLRETA